MAERELAKQRETEAKEKGHYQDLLKMWAQRRDKALKDRVVMRAKELPWQQNEMGRAKYFLMPTIEDTVTGEWQVFVHDIRSHSGRHRHQGGLAIFVLEGKGWTTVDGKRFDWEEGDLILLPVKPQGVSHQHFNAEEGKPCKWVGLIYTPFVACTGYLMEQQEKSPDATHV